MLTHTLMLKRSLTHIDPRITMITVDGDEA